MATKKKVTKKVVKSKTISRKKIISPKNLEVKTKKTTTALLYSAITFILSLILFLATKSDSFEEAIFGFIMILSGALVILFLVIELIFYFSKKKK